MLVACESAWVELQVKNHSAKKIRTSRSADTHIYLRDLAKSLDYTTNLETERFAQLVFDVPRSARTVSAHPRHGGDVDEGEGEAIAVRKRPCRYFRSAKSPLYAYLCLLGVRTSCSSYPVAIFPPATLPPPPLEPYPYLALDAYLDAYLNYNPSPLLPREQVPVASDGDEVRRQVCTRRAGHCCGVYIGGGYQSWGCQYASDQGYGQSCTAQSCCR
ncbi:hypothetical protein H4582DRAFT_796424 [Lactarius indigo]|nr:hypothetical protein H4582DRAFT_796424 [Lactarius indigo]